MTFALTLASSSEIRARLLRAAGIEVEILPGRIDEEAIRAALEAEGATPRDVADALAEMKAAKISARRPGHLVLGADQVLELKGRIFAKPETPEEAIEHLRALSGQTHRLLSALVALVLLLFAACAAQVRLRQRAARAAAAGPAVSH